MSCREMSLVTQPPQVISSQYGTYGRMSEGSLIVWHSLLNLKPGTLNFEPGTISR